MHATVVGVILGLVSNVAAWASPTEVRDRVVVKYTVLTQKLEAVPSAKIVIVGPIGSLFFPQARVTDDKGKLELQLVTGEYYFFIEEPTIGYAYNHFHIKEGVEIDAPLVPFSNPPELTVYTFDRDTSAPLFNINVSATLPMGKSVSGTSSSGTYSIPFDWNDPAAGLTVTIQHAKYDDFQKVYDQPRSSFWLVPMTKGTKRVRQTPKPAEPEKVPPPITKPAQKIDPIPSGPPPKKVDTNAIKLGGYIQMASKNYAVIGAKSTVLVNIRYSGGTQSKLPGNILVAVKNPKGKVITTQTFSTSLVLNKSMGYRFDVKPDMVGKFTVSVDATGDGSAKWNGTFTFTANAK